MSAVKFPYGISNIEKLSSQGFVFVDKTCFIEKLEKNTESYVSYLRPRKFGKSLWLSILEYYYDVKQESKFNKLFGKYYIGKYPTPARNSYRILKFDFSGIDTSTPESTKQGFNLSVQGALQEFNNKYNIFSQLGYIENKDAEEMMFLFFRNYPKDLPIYLLFDEYDHFTNDILYRNKHEFIETVSKQGYVRKFYEVIKTATQQGIADRVFITGVSPVTLDGLTSGFNILTNLTHNPEYETMMGFTEDEVRELLKLVLRDKSRENEIMNEMREWYNGYKFCESSEQSIYNTDMVLYYLKEFKDTQQSPKRLLDINIAPDYGKIKQMFRVLDVHKHYEVLTEILQKGYIDTELVSIFNFDRGFTQTDFINFLAYLGNLTIDRAILENIVRFRIPNRVIEILYWQYYGEVLQEQADLSIDVLDAIQPAILEMALQGNHVPFFNLVENLLKELSNRDFSSKFNEKYIKLAILAYISQISVFDIRSENELKGGGYPDIMLLRKSTTHIEHHEYVIELKYLKKEQENALEKTKQEAKEQILNYYHQDKTLQNKPYLHLLIVVAVKDVLYIEEVVK